MVPQSGIKPFLRWAGGKRWLAPLLRTLMPQSVGTYIEPFLGSGAIYFDCPRSTAILSDTNEELIRTYEAIRDDWHGVADLLQQHKALHCSDHYYAERARVPAGGADLAARFLYLNRTCWNGVYRVNRNGQFNVPLGSPRNVVLPTDNFQAVAEQLQHATFIIGDFSVSVARAGQGDLIYADPPYTVRHNTNGFVKYNQQLFTWSDQERLRDSLFSAVERGASFVLSNANHESILELYSGACTVLPFSRGSLIAGDRSKRGTFSELVITSFPVTGVEDERIL